MQEVLKSIDKTEYLLELRRAISFLQDIPDEIYFQLDSSEFYLPVGEVAQSRKELEDQIGHFVMTYKRDVFNLTIPVERHLCANVKGANLTEQELSLLLNFENRHAENNVSFVAYQKPLEIISPHQSNLYKLFEERGHCTLADITKLLER